MRARPVLTVGLLLGLTLGPALAESPAGLAPEALTTSLPEAWEGFTRDAPEYTPAPDYTGEVGSVRARYASGQGSASPVEYVLRLSDLGARAGKSYAEYGADYLKGPVQNDSEHSLEIKGQPALLTSTSDTTMQIVTFFAPGLVVSVSCMNASEAECQATLERLDFDALKALAATVPPA